MEKITKHNYKEYKQTLENNLDRLIEFQKKFGCKIEYIEYGLHIDLARHLRKNLDKVALHIHEFCFDPVNTGRWLSASAMIEVVYRYRYLCYNDSIGDPATDFLTLYDQNMRAKNHPEGDISVPNNEVRTFKSIEKGLRK